MSEIIKVGMGELKVASAPDHIRTSGLGSCVAVTLYDPLQKIAGLAHVMLPASQEFLNQEFLNKGAKEGKYADRAIPLLVDKMVAKGGHPRFFEAKLVGGAQMFTFFSKGETMRIGPRNVQACQKILRQIGIPIVAEVIGGNISRTIEIDASTGILSIFTGNKNIMNV